MECWLLTTLYLHLASTVQSPKTSQDIFPMKKVRHGSPAGDSIHSLSFHLTSAVSKPKKWSR
jgi:hypothetical protein